MRRYLWLLPVVVVFGLIGYLVYTYGISGRRAAAEADDLVADLTAHGEAIERADLPEVPDKPTATELHYRINTISEWMDETRTRAGELQRRAEKMVGHFPRDREHQVNEALSLYVTRLRAAQEKSQRRTDELQAKINELRKPPRA